MHCAHSAWPRPTLRLACHLGIGALCLLSGVSAQQVRAATIYVNATAPGPDHTGRTWETAFTNLPPALSIAADGDEIHVAQGTYAGGISLPPGIAVMGGYAGVAPDPDARSASLYPTVLRGPESGSVVIASGGRLDGVTIEGGTAPYGGGVYVYPRASVTLSGVTIRNCHANRGGGALYAMSASPVIGDCVFTSNTATDMPGGALMFVMGSPTVERCVIAGNACEDNWGGGIALLSAGGRIANNMILNNRATHGGGIVLYNSTAAVVNNTVVNNEALTEGGPIDNYGGSATIANNILAFNTRGIKMDGPPAAMTNNIVYANSGYNYLGTYAAGAEAGNISADPALVPGANGVFHIRPDSPARHAGSATYLSPGDRDIEGRPRGASGAPDIGASESDGQMPEETPQVVRVTPGGNDALDGTTWQTAKATLQAAINGIGPFGGQVWARTGTFAETVQLRTGVSLYGGFAGSEARRSDRKASTPPTVLDGQGTHRLLVVPSGCSALSVAEGFRMTAGRADNGGGVYIAPLGSLTLSNVSIDNCSAQGAGGALYGYGASPIISDCTFINNTAGDQPGGALAFSDGAPQVLRCLIEGNVSTSSWGGGLAALSSSGLFACNVIANNRGTHGGGAVLYESTGRFINNTVVGNQASTEGGPIDIYGGSPAVANNILAFNNRGVKMDGQPVCMRNNDVFANGDGNYEGPYASGAASEDLAIDPGFIDRAAGNYHLQANSPLRDRGSNADAVDIMLDMDSTPRRQGGSVDVGAYEIVGTLPYTLAEAAQAMRLAGGMAASGSTDMNRFDSLGDGSIGLSDAVDIARRVGGLAPNP